MFGDKANGAKASKPQTGVQMMLKAMGIDLDPEIFAETGAAVIEVRDRLRRIEANQNKIISALYAAGVLKDDGSSGSNHQG